MIDPADSRRACAPAVHPADPRIDRLVAGLVAANAVLALVIAQSVGDLATALTWGLACLVPAALAALTPHPPLLRRMLLATSLVGLVALQIHLERGVTEFHFNVFVTLSALLAYRDWRVIVYTGALFAVHHLAFDRMLAAGLGTYCLAAPSLERVAIHAGFVIAQCLYLVKLATLMNRRSFAGRELDILVNDMGRDGPVRLGPPPFEVATRTGRSLLRVQARMIDALRQIGSTTDHVLAASDQLASGSSVLSDRSERIARELGDLSMSLEQIVVIVRSNNEAATAALTMAEQASRLADNGGALVGEVVRNMNEIDASSAQVSAIVSTIDGLAFQTNILALNAAIEAARAGEHGRGFAVVAGEVRRLALSSATAAHEIKALIDASSRTVGTGTQLVRKAGETIEELVRSVQTIGKLFQDLNADTSANADGLHSVTNTMAELTELTRGNSEIATESASAVDSLRREVDRLADVLTRFDVGPAVGKAMAVGPAHMDMPGDGPGAPPRASSRRAARAASAPAPAPASAPAAAAEPAVEFF